MITLLKLLEIVSSRYIIVFEGEWGKGKTLSMIALANMLLQYMGLSNVLTKVPVNFYNVHNLNYYPLTQTSQLEEVLDGTIILEDEMLDDIDRRNSLSPINKFLTNFAKKYRKIDVRLLGTVQYISMIDERLLQMMQILITPTFKKKYHKEVKEDIKIRMSKKEYGVYGDWRMKWNIYDSKEDKNYTIFVNLSQFIDMYDTKYIPSKLAITHSDYLEWFKVAQSKAKNELLLTMNEEHIRSSKIEWEEGMKLLRGEL